LFLRSKHLLGTKDLQKEEIELILNTAESFEEVLEREIKKVPTLRGKTIVNFFAEPSTRTRTSFELAAKRLSADVVNISGKGSALVKGESLVDTARTLESMHVDAVVVRHRAAGVPHLLSRMGNFSVINAGDGMHEHPTQALLDLYTVRKRFGSLRGLKMAIVGDILHSRVARSNIFAFTKMGVEVVLVAPYTLIPADVEALGIEVFPSLKEVLSEVDIIYLLRLQLERQEETFIPSLREYSEFYGLGIEELKNCKEGAVVMHPGPLNRGVEIRSEVADSPVSLVQAQVESGVAVRMAVLYLLLGGMKKE
jgi:aspartate carbamoyltransferase catalytic subunit